MIRWNRKTACCVLSFLIGAVFYANLPAASALDSKDGRPVPEMDRQYNELAVRIGRLKLKSLRLAIHDLMQSFPSQYSDGPEYLRRLEQYAVRLPQIRQRLEQGDRVAAREAREILKLARDALLANPLLDFDRLLLIKRRPLGDPRRPEAPDKGFGEFLGLPKQSSWQLDTMPETFGWDNEIAMLSPVGPDGTLTTLYRPCTDRLVSDIDLQFSANRLMFSMPDDNRDWQVFEIGADGKHLHQLTPANQPSVHNYDSCYLPDGAVAFISTAPLQGVPCNDGVVVGTIYRMDADGQNIRQLCFDQDHDYCPTVMNDGRILYLRWEYADLPHNWTRILFAMNPDGTEQQGLYGTGSYWPNAIFYARAIPGHPTKVVGVITGHHVGRVGELLIFDPARGRQDADGVVQRIPGYQQPVVPLIQDQLTLNSWPKFVHPYPLSEKYFIVSCKPTPNDLWGIYLVDVFDNIVLLKEIERYSLLEPIPFRNIEPPPVIPDKADRKQHEGIVYLEDVYAGPGLKSVPHGAVKSLRLFTYHFAYQHLSGGQHRIGTDGPWEPKRVLGTVPVEADGSAMFRVPANTPISVQPLDAKGRALQLMRSWMTAMPGEVVSCVGCHRRQNSSPINRSTLAARRGASPIKPWRGPVRGFSFERDVQPVLDEYCVNCHDGTIHGDAPKLADLRGDQKEFIVFANKSSEPKKIHGIAKEELVREYSGVFPPAYVELRRFVRVGGLESDLHMLHPSEFHANTCELIQMLEKGHHGVQLDEEAWDRIVTWIDLNAPCHGTWGETVGIGQIAAQHERRRELAALYGGVTLDHEAIPSKKGISPISAIPIAVKRPVTYTAKLDLSPFSAQLAATGCTTRTLDLGNGVTLELVLIPPGEFVMGDASGDDDEKPLTSVRIGKPFWIGKCEVTNGQYGRFDLSHDSRFEHGAASSKTEAARGPRLNLPDQPVVRVSWQDAITFCKWLSQIAEQTVSLPTEAQWEYACRAGTTSPFSYGDSDTDFSPFANMADKSIGGWANWSEKRRSADILPRDARFNDRALVTTAVGHYRPNAWGLHDMHGNVWEWTQSTYKPYPYQSNDGRNRVENATEKVVRGGSWSDRPKRCRSAYRLSYPTWQKVYNVGFRIVVEAHLPDVASEDN